MIRLIISFLVSISILFSQTFQVGKNGVVVSASQIASDIGIEVLKQGGNAVDAAVAVGFALAVVFPEAGNIGGGGFMVIRFPDGNSTTIDYREKAPGTASRDMYLDKKGDPIEGLSTEGALSVGVPGSVAGLHLALEKYGSLPWDEVIKPAIELAEKGFPVSYYTKNGLLSHKDIMSRFPSSMEMFFPESKILESGEKFCFPDLAKTLKRIAMKGPDEFYRGKTAKNIVRSVRKYGGIISLEDMRNYKAVERKPINFSYRGYDIISMPPPSSGGICLAEILKIVEHFPLSDYGFHSSKFVQALVEAERRVYANRAYFLGDPDFVNVPVEYLISDELAANLAEDIKFDKATPSNEITHVPVVFPIQESEQTTHFSIVDKNGMAVSNTTTLNSSFGSCFVAEGTGVLLNDEMDDFSIKPGYPNIYGLVGAEANAIQPNKRMLSSMTPTIVSRNDSLMWILGTPGGATIITTVAQVIINLIDFNMDLIEAVDLPRFHHQWLPDEVFIEKYSFSKDIKDILKGKGYAISERWRIADVNAIAVDYENGYYIGVPDKRRQSAAAAY